jgi:hypothetical protein
VNRYRARTSTSVEEHPDGDWVRWEEAQTLAAEVDRLSKALEAADKRLAAVAEVAEPPCRECRAVGYHKMDCTHARRGG